MLRFCVCMVVGLYVCLTWARPEQRILLACNWGFEPSVQAEKFCRKRKEGDLPLTIVKTLTPKIKGPVYSVTEQGAKSLKLIGATSSISEQGDEEKTVDVCTVNPVFDRALTYILIQYPDAKAKELKRREIKTTSSSLPAFIKSWLKIPQPDNPEIGPPENLSLWETEDSRAQYIAYIGNDSFLKAASFSRDGKVTELRDLLLEAADDKYYPTAKGVYQIGNKIYLYAAGYSGRKNGLLEFSGSWSVKEPGNPCDGSLSYSLKE